MSWQEKHLLSYISLNFNVDRNYLGILVKCRFWLIWSSECVLVAQSCPTLCDPMDCSPPGSFVHGILQARIVAWVTIPFSRGSSRPTDQTHISCVSCIAGGFFTVWATREAQWASWGKDNWEMWTSEVILSNQELNRPHFLLKSNPVIFLQITVFLRNTGNIGTSNNEDKNPLYL